MRRPPLTLWYRKIYDRERKTLRRTLCGVVYGPPKVGKSWLLDTMPGPRLIVDAEGSHEFTRSQKIVWDPQRDRPPEADGTWNTCLVHGRDYDTIDKVYQWLASGQHPFVSLGFDHLTEIQDKIIAKFNGTSALREADWGTLLRHMKDFVRKNRDLRYHPTQPIQTIVFNCHARTIDGLTGPMLSGQFRDALPGMVDFIGYVWVDRTEDGQRRRMLIEPDPKFIAGQRVDALVEAYGPVVDIKNQKHPELGGYDFADMMEAIQV